MLEEERIKTWLGSEIMKLPSYKSEACSGTCTVATRRFGMMIFSNILPTWSKKSPFPYVWFIILISDFSQFAMRRYLVLVCTYSFHGQHTSPETQYSANFLNFAKNLKRFEWMIVIKSAEMIFVKYHLDPRNWDL